MRSKINQKAWATQAQASGLATLRVPLQRDGTMLHANTEGRQARYRQTGQVLGSQEEAANGGATRGHLAQVPGTQHQLSKLGSGELTPSLPMEDNCWPTCPHIHARLWIP